MIYRRECPKHSTFDSDLLVCVVNEVDGGEKSDSSERGEPEHHQKVKFECTEAGNFSNLNVKTKYYECQDMAEGKLKTQDRNCPRNHEFSQQDRQCIPIAIGGKHSFILLKFVMVKKIIQDE